MNFVTLATTNFHEFATMPNDIQFNVNTSTLVLANLIIAMNMFAVSLNLRRADFSLVLQNKKPMAVGLLAQFALLPFVAFVFSVCIPMHPGLVLALIMVSCVPGGNLSNVFSFIAKGNLPLSISLTAVGFLFAPVVTPLNFAMYSSLHPGLNGIVNNIHIDPVQLGAAIVVTLLIPLALGYWAGNQFPRFYKRVAPYISRFALTSIAVLVVLVLKDNVHLDMTIIVNYAGEVAGLQVLVLGSAYLFASAFKLPTADRRTIAIEAGIQNAPLGVVLLLTFMPTQSTAMAAIAFWGGWQILACTAIALYWKRVSDPVPNPG